MIRGAVALRCVHSCLPNVLSWQFSNFTLVLVPPRSDSGHYSTAPLHMHALVWGYIFEIHIGIVWLAHDSARMYLILTGAQMGAVALTMPQLFKRYLDAASYHHGICQNS